MKRIHNKDDIVQVGLDLVLSRGFNATGVEAILKQANIPKGSFYNFFSSKEEFALAIIDKFVADRVELLYPIFSDESLPPLERVRRSFEILIDELNADEELRASFFRSPYATLRAAGKEWGLPLSDTEIHVLIASGHQLWKRVTDAFDAELLEAA